MSHADKHETGETVITVRIPRGLMEKVEVIMADRFSTKSEYIRDLIRRDVLEARAMATQEEAAA
jgi:metal-responsive CopG/Arc/MetJ family transcriptional regulator